MIYNSYTTQKKAELIIVVNSSSIKQTVEQGNDEGYRRILHSHKGFHSLSRFNNPYNVKCMY